MQSKQGFTLIEILVIMVIFGITISLAVLSFGDFGAKREAKMTAEQFVAYIHLLQQKAILEDLTIGLDIDKDGYQPFVYITSKGWTTISDNNLFKKQNLPKKIFINHIRIYHSSSKDAKIIINPSGDMEAFSAYFGTQSIDKLIYIQGTNDGKLSIKEMP